jgi:hypothetical protein
MAPEFPATNVGPVMLAPDINILFSYIPYIIADQERPL